MSLPVFVADHLLADVGSLAGISESEARHAIQSQRITVGEHIELIDNTGTRAVVEVESISGKNQLVGIIESITHEPPASPQVTVVQALPKSERSELAIDLLTQAGANVIVPWQASRCIAKWPTAKQQKGVAKWEAAALAAAKQSRRAYIPQITGLKVTSEVEKLIAEADLALVLDEQAEESVKNLPLADAKNIVLIIGPEGGITEEESAAFQAAGAKSILLGPEVLRTASAGMVALAAIGMRTARWGEKGTNR
jgi:hypothetical protein